MALIEEHRSCDRHTECDNDHKTVVTLEVSVRAINHDGQLGAPERDPLFIKEIDACKHGQEQIVKEVEAAVKPRRQRTTKPKAAAEGGGAE